MAKIEPFNGVYLGPEENDQFYQGGKLGHNLILFGRVCRALGMNVTPNRMMEVGRALEHIKLGNKQDFYYTLQSHLVTHPKELEYFDEAFNLFWRRPPEGFTTLNLESMYEQTRQRKTTFLPPLDSSPDDGSSSSRQIDESMVAIVPTYSKEERLKKKDFAQMTAEELEMAKRVIQKMPESLGMRKTRRFEVGKGRQINMRRLMKDMIRKRGDITEIPTHRHRENPVRLC